MSLTLLLNFILGKWKKTVDLSTIQNMVIARQQGTTMDALQPILARMAMEFMEEIVYENANTMVTGLARSHAAEEVSFIIHCSCKFINSHDEIYMYVYVHPKVCGHLKDPEYGHCKTNGEHYGSVATYSCNDGYILYGGSRSRKCLDDGYWSGKEPQCRKCKLEELN